MKIAIVFDSITQNTKTVAEAICQALPQTDVVYCGAPASGIDADCYLVGSWTDKGMCSDKIKSFLETLHHKTVAYFATAGFGGSASYYEKLFDRVSAVIPKDNLLASPFFCQGKMPMSVRDRYVQLMTAHPEDRSLAVSIQNFDEALAHPNGEDLQNAQNWAKEVVEQAQTIG